MNALDQFFSGACKAVEDLPFHYIQATGAATAGLSATVGALTAGVISTTAPFVAAAICGYASIITLVAMGILKADEGLKVVCFIAVPIVSTLLLSLAATTMGFPVSISLALILSVATTTTTMLGLNYLQIL